MRLPSLGSLLLLVDNGNYVITWATIATEIFAMDRGKEEGENSGMAKETRETDTVEVTPERGLGF